VKDRDASGLLVTRIVLPDEPTGRGGVAAALREHLNFGIEGGATLPYDDAPAAVRRCVTNDERNDQMKTRGLIL
jgi:hypothetical protein